MPETAKKLILRLAGCWGREGRARSPGSTAYEPGRKPAATVRIPCRTPKPTLSKASSFSSVPFSGGGGRQEKRPSWGCLTQKPSAQPSRRGFASVPSPGHSPVLSGGRGGARGARGWDTGHSRALRPRSVFRHEATPELCAAGRGSGKLAGREREEGEERSGGGGALARCWEPAAGAAAGGKEEEEPEQERERGCAFALEALQPQEGRWPPRSPGSPRARPASRSRSPGTRPYPQLPLRWGWAAAAGTAGPACSHPHHPMR